LRQSDVSSIASIAIPPSGSQPRQTGSLNFSLRHEVARLIVCCDTRSHGWSSGTLEWPDLLFHQQYPTQMCGKVTTRPAPADTVPTGTRLAPEPCGNGVSASIKRRWGWMDGMVNSGELSINVVTTNKPKMLRGLGQKGTGAGTGSQTYPVMDSQRSRRTESTSPVLVNRAERGKPVSLLLER